MSTLRIVNCSPTAADTLSSLRRVINLDDGILLTGDGVYLGLQQDNGLTQPLHALKPDVTARGLLTQWPTTIPLLDHAGYVSLCIEHEKALNWSGA